MKEPMLDHLRIGQTKTVNGSRLLEEIESNLVNEFWQKYDQQIPFVVRGASQQSTPEPGQIWSNGKDKILIEKEWDKFLFIKDRYGDRKKMSKNEVEKLIRSGKYKLTSSKNFETLMKTLSALIIPYMGVFLGGALVAIISRFIKSRGIK